MGWLPLQREYELTEPVTSQIRSLIQSTKELGKTHFKEVVMDGFPVTVAIIFGDGSKPTIISGNLCGLTDEQKQDDRIKLSLLLVSVICDAQYT